MTIEIRKAAIADAEIIALLGRLTFRETFGALFLGREAELIDYLDRTFSVTKIASSLSMPKNRYWLALLDGLPVGYAKQKLGSQNALIDDTSPAQLQKIYVLSEFIAHKIGHQLLKATLIEAEIEDVKVMWLSVLDINTHAIRFYERHGWATAGTAHYEIGTQRFSYLIMQTLLPSE
jgi:diamine N-acetyltransferase